MLESICVTEKLHWPKTELSRKSVLSLEVHKLNINNENSLQHPPSGILKDIFTTGTSSYNVLLQSKEDKKHHAQKQPSAQRKKHRRAAKCCCGWRGGEPRRVRAPGGGCCGPGQPALPGPGPGPAGCGLRPAPGAAPSAAAPPPRPRSRTKRHPGLTKPKQSQSSKGRGKEGDGAGQKLCLLTAIKPSNVEKEKVKFFDSDFTYNPQFEYENPALPNVLAKHSHASDRFLKQSINIMKRTLQKYGSYEKFEQATGGSLLTKSRIWNHVRKYMVKEGCLGEIVVHLTEDLLSRASMTVVNGRPTLTINVSTAREHWLEGMLRHEIGTHYFRGFNNNSQPWCNRNGRRKHGLKPINPTEEGLASIHSVLFRKDPFLWRAALLYYTVYQASQMSFSQLFHDVGKFVEDPNTRWDYCVRAKRGWTDTSQPGCFNKDQVYLDGILRILRYRESIDFHLLTALGKISYEDVDRLKGLAVIENMRVPHFLQDHARYMEHLKKIMEVNELTDEELQDLIN
ncbi:putative tyrosine carboxypeptidase MATCAP2 isoform X1 [Hirundo rustica]|uniref:putative tyrosine carboxypeptidase MATCAP2 isoform X1 n=2 Tax=Hirundo rustica TaxID=43150 RepID=UPI001A953BD3|nr:putative tyrosine carboxypeptidase MATCAP2 isoform X1 [Hirundo rustica]